ncbi:MAG: c-type cytochrome [Chloroflexi bacterium]|nr:c-type cytochrome [Chloroflexota bacterium]
MCLCLFGALLVACTSALPTGDAVRGRALFNAPVASLRGDLPACSRCHAVEARRPSPMGLGTNFHDLGARAGRTVPGKTAADYLYTSIVNPDTFLAGGYQDGLMSREYEKLLTRQQIDDLVAYMLTLR